MEDDDAGDGVLLALLRVPFLPIGRVVSAGLCDWLAVVPLTFALGGGDEDRVGKSDGRLQVEGAWPAQGLITRQFSAGEIHLLQTIDGDDWNNTELNAIKQLKLYFFVANFSSL